MNTRHRYNLSGDTMYQGLSSDTKPTENVPQNAIYTELDTGDQYFFDEEWVKMATPEEKQADLLSIMVRDQLLTTPNWGDIQKIVRQGLAKDVFEIGDQIATTYMNGDTELECLFDVVHFGKVYDQDGKEHDGMFLQAHHAMPLGVQFSNYQAFYYAKDGLSAGTYNIKWGNGWGTHVVNGKSYQFTLTQAVPAGGQLSGFYGAPDQAPTNWKVYSWESNSAVTPIETVSVTEGTGGTNLGTISSNTKTETLNAMQSVAYGYNRWNQSAVEQYLNSEGDNWWVPKSNFDRRPDQYNQKGFLTGFNSDFLEVLQPVKVLTSANTIIDGGVTDHIGGGD